LLFHIDKRFNFFKLLVIETIPPRNMVRAPIHIQITSGL